MATDDLELLRADIEDHITRRVAEAIGGLLQRVASLRGLAKALEAAGEITHDADGDQLEETAAGIRALATEAVTSATGCIAVSERLRAYAGVRSLVDVPDSKELEQDQGKHVQLDGHAPPAAPADRPRRGRTRGQR
jgi:hypothetical protein